MTSPWLERIGLKGLMCLLESYWIATLATLLLFGSPATMLILCAAALAAAAAVALALREGLLTEKAAQIAAAALLLAMVVVLVVPHVRDDQGAIFGYFVGAVLVSGLVVGLGVGIGRTRAAPEELLARALRVGVLTFVVLLVGERIDPERVSAVPVVVATLLTAVVMLAFGRLVAVIGVVERRQRRLLSYWVVAVALVTVAILLAAAGLAGTLDSRIVASVIDTLGAGLRHALDVVAYVLAGIAYVVTRIIYWFAQLAHVHPSMRKLPEPLASGSPRPTPAPNTGWDAGVYRWLGRGLVAVVFALFVAWFVLKIVRRARDRSDEGFDEEREYLIGAADVVRAVGGRLRAAMRRVARLREARPRDPNEALRREYRDLERALAPLGVVRAAGASARAFLLVVDQRIPTALVDALATGYERARYSRAGVDWSDVEGFRAARLQLLAALSAP